MIVFVFWEPPEKIRFSYGTKKTNEEQLLGCGGTKEELWDLVKDRMPQEDFLTAYQQLLKTKIYDWKDYPFERMKEQAFLNSFGGQA